MSTMCECGHYKSQHPSGVCDYAGYSCSCTGYRKKTKRTFYYQTHNDPDELGRQRFTLFWKQDERDKAQEFFAVLDEYIRRLKSDGHEVKPKEE